MLDTSQLRFLTYTLVVIFVALCGSGVLASCPNDFHVIPIQDARDAAFASRYVYKDNSAVGGRIPQTKYDVIKIVEKRFLGESIKVIVADKGSDRIIAFRGTNSGTQLLQQFIIGAASLLRRKHAFIPRNGITEMVMALEFVIEAHEELQDDLAIYMNNTKLRYIITGHSLGGAIGSLFALMQRANAPDTWKNSGTCLITFGAPRVGGASYAMLHDEMISPNRKVRFVNGLDIVPHIPSSSDVFKFQHHSREVWLSTLLKMGNPLKKCRTIGWLKKRVCLPIPFTAAWKVCMEGDDKECSNRRHVFRVLDHGIDRYIHQLLNVPDIIYDKYNHKDTRWSTAMTHSCSSY